jgi:Domain of unknown function (DUF397)
MIALLKTWFRRLPVGFAEWAGWLNSVDESLVKSYLRDTERQINRDLANTNVPFANFVKPQACIYLWFCAEVAHKDGFVAVRNSSDPTRTTVVFTIDEWRVFVDGIKNGEFDFCETRTEGLSALQAEPPFDGQVKSVRNS